MTNYALLGYYTNLNVIKCQHCPFRYSVAFLTSRSLIPLYTVIMLNFINQYFLGSTLSLTLFGAEIQKSIPVTHSQASWPLRLLEFLPVIESFVPPVQRSTCMLISSASVMFPQLPSLLHHHFSFSFG